MINNQKTVLINVSFNHKNANISISLNLSLAQLKQLIFTHFQIDTMHYSLFYKNTRIGLSNHSPCYTILGKEKSPKFYIITKEIKSNDKIEEIAEEKKAHQTVADSSIRSKKLHISSDSKASVLKKNLYFLKKNNSSLSSSVPDRSLPSIPSIQTPQKSVVSPSASASLQRCGFVFKEKKSFFKDKVRTNPAIYMSFEERRIKEAYDDKKNWIDKRGFFKSVGSYSMKPLYIPNYVNKTPSDPPLNHKFRETRKKQWLDKKGFFLA